MTGRIRAGVTVLLAVAAGAGAGCAKLPEIPVPGLYRLDVRQGNALDDEALARLETGMDRSRVLHLLGSPAVSDVFHPDRWEYLYSFAPGGEPQEWRRITLHFEDDRLARIEGDVRPAEEAASPPDPPRVVLVPPRPPPTGLFGRLLRRWGKDP